MSIFDPRMGRNNKQRRFSIRQKHPVVLVWPRPTCCLLRRLLRLLLRLLLRRLLRLPLRPVVLVWPSTHFRNLFNHLYLYL